MPSFLSFRLGQRAAGSTPMAGTRRRRAASLMVGILFAGAMCQGVCHGAAADAPRKPAVAKTPDRLRTSWRASMHSKPASGSGCFKATYPQSAWTPVACATPRPANRVPQGIPVNYGQSDWMIQAGGSVTSNSGSIATATGNIYDVFGVTSETVANGNNNGIGNVYSLQMNTNAFATPAWCTAAHPANCNGAVQFLFDNNDSGGPNGTRRSYIYITYILNNYGATCPSAQWLASNGSCYLELSGSAVPVLPLAAFADLTLTGGISAGNDFVTFSAGSGSVYRYQATGSTLGLSNWNQVQFNVFGDASNLNSGPGQGAQANFGPGSTMQVATSINAQAGLTASCYQNSLTAETANLGAASACTPAPNTYGINFVQGTPPINVAISPQTGPSNGSTSISITGIGFTPQAIATFGNTTQNLTCDTTTHCTGTVPAGTSSFNVQVANVSPATSVAGVYSAPAPANQFSYLPVPACSFSESCLVFANNPPNYALTCPSQTDFYGWSGTPISPTQPPADAYLLSSGTSSTGTTTDTQIFVAACTAGTRNQCQSYSLYVPVANYCHTSGGGGSGGGGVTSCRQCEETGRQCQIVNGKPRCIGVIQ